MSLPSLSGRACRRATHLALAALLAAGLGACSSFNQASERAVSIVTPYKVEVVQGNFVSKEQVAALQPGMSREQVKSILGTPLIGSLFHANRWDYVFTIRRKGVDQPPKRLTVLFKNGLLERTEGDEMPSEAEFVKNIDNSRSLGKVPPLVASDDQLNKISAAAASDAAPTPAPVAPDRSYPPLEP